MHKSFILDKVIRCSVGPKSAQLDVDRIEWFSQDRVKLHFQQNNETWPVFRANETIWVKRSDITGKS